MKIYCDGSANPNPGPGGFGVLALDKDEKICYHIYRESSQETTNNREELKAILYCMKHFGILTNGEDEFNFPIVYSDSAYAINSYTNWMFSWEKNNWRKLDGGKIENLDLISEYFELYQKGYRIQLVKVKGHSGNKWHDFVDDLAANRIPRYELKENIVDG